MDLIAERKVDRPSMQNRNRYEDRGSPGLRPQNEVKVLNGLPLIRIDQDGDLMQSITRSTQASAKPRAITILSKTKNSKNKNSINSIISFTYIILSSCDVWFTFLFCCEKVQAFMTNDNVIHDGTPIHNGILLLQCDVVKKRLNSIC